MKLFLGEEILGKLSDAEQYTWNFIEDNQSKILTMSITGLADLAHVSTATVVRTLQKRGFAGFSDYKSSVKRDQMKVKCADLEIQGLTDEANEFIVKNVEEVVRTVKLLDAKSLSNVVNVLKNARQIMIVAQGSSVSIANDLAYRLCMLGVNATCIYYDNMNVLVSNLTADDAIFVLSNSAETQALIPVVKTAKKNNVKIVTLTCNHQGILAKSSDYVLLAHQHHLEHSQLTHDAASRMMLEMLCRILLDLFLLDRKL